MAREFAGAAVVTGASSGIGQTTAEALARQGSQLVTAARTGEALSWVARSRNRLGAQAPPVVTDIADAASVKARRRRR